MIPRVGLKQKREDREELAMPGHDPHTEGWREIAAHDRTGICAYVMVDDDVYWRLLPHRLNINANGYPVFLEHGADRPTLLHRWVMAPIPTEAQIDHRNHNLLDARRDNLRVAERWQNRQNSKVRKDSATGLKCVVYDSRHGRYRARLTVNKVRYSSKWVRTAEEAYDMYVQIQNMLAGDFAYNPSQDARLAREG